MDSQVSLITGATGGIGAATVSRLLAAGNRVTALGRDEVRLARLARGVGATPDELHTVAGDATVYADLQVAVATTIERFGRLDHVIANAGFSTRDTLATGDPDAWRDMILTNVLGPAVLAKAALPALKESGGRIVYVGSVAGVKHTPGNMYSVTKWAVTALAENTRLLVTGDGVGVTLIAPGRVDTPFWGEGGAPDGPILTAEQIADVIVWTLQQPPGVDLNTVVVRPVGQTA